MEHNLHAACLKKLSVDHVTCFCYPHPVTTHEYDRLRELQCTTQLVSPRLAPVTIDDRQVALRILQSPYRCRQLSGTGAVREEAALLVVVEVLIRRETLEFRIFVIFSKNPDEAKITSSGRVMKPILKLLHDSNFVLTKICPMWSSASWDENWVLWKRIRYVMTDRLRQI